MTTTNLDTYRAHLKQRLIESHVSEHVHGGLIEYIATRRPTGGFLEAVLSNDLREACARADEQMRPHLYDLVLFLYNYSPGICWSSPELVEAWLAKTEPPLMVFK